MPDSHRPLSEGKIAALESLKLAYDDAHDVGEEPRHFAAKRDDLLAGGATTSDLLWLVKMRFVEHVREVTRNGSPRREFQATNDMPGPDSCFFLTYLGNSHVSREQLHRGRPRAPQDTPLWDAAEGSLYWHGTIVLHLAAHASAERAVLDEFEARHWRSPISTPIARDDVGDPTQSRRNAIYNLNRHLGKDPPMKFFCLQGDLIGWSAPS